jgi:hypothetical protein
VLLVKRVNGSATLKGIAHTIIYAFYVALQYVLR